MPTVSPTIPTRLKRWWQQHLLCHWFPLATPIFWQQRGWRAWLLYPFSLLYHLAIQLRVIYYNKLARKAQRPIAIHRSAKILVVGNILVGGTGKTPLVAYLAQFFTAQGYRTAILTRGYGGRPQDNSAGHRTDHPSYPLWVTPTSDPRQVGDEACLLARISARIPVVIDPQRARAATQLAHLGYQIIISDDGLQHYALPRDGEIALFNSEYGLGNGLLLPAGPLREPTSRLDRVDWLVINKNHPCASIAPRLTQLTNRYPSQIIYTQPQALVSLVDPSVRHPLAQWRGRSVVAITAIGYPPKFWQTLTALGIQIAQRFSYPDHHHFTAAEQASWGTELVVMTQKDAMKIQQPTANYWYLAIDVAVDEQFQQQLLAWAGGS